MVDPFLKQQDEMSRSESTIPTKDSTASPDQVRQMLMNRHVCPYCGHQYAGETDACPKCTMEDTPATRQATKARIGPWYVLQSRNPSAPGMKYVTLMSLLRKGYITPKSVVRGPTTYQLWRFAANVRGVSREFGLCYSCGEAISRTASNCPACQRSQDAPMDPDLLLEPRQNGTPQPQPANGASPEPAPAPLNPPVEAAPIIIETTPPASEPAAPAVVTAIQPVVEGSYTRRLRDLNHRHADRQEQQGSISPSESRPPARRGIAPVFSGKDVSAMSLARALRDDPPKEMLVPSRFKTKVVLAAAAIIVVAAAAVFYLRPDIRKKSVNLVSQTYATVSEKLNRNVWRSPPPAARRPAKDPQSAPAVAEGVRQPRTSEAPPTITQPIQPLAANNLDAASTPATMPVVEARSQDPNAALDQARALWVQALDAESKHDFTSAIRFYEQIRQLPSDAWPGGLQINIDLARHRMQSTEAQ